MNIPGINGVINVFSSIDIPGSLESIEMYLHYISNFTTFVTVGNTTLLNSPNKTEQKLLFSNSNLSSVLVSTPLFFASLKRILSRAVLSITYAGLFDFNSRQFPLGEKNLADFILFTIIFLGRFGNSCNNL
jgi:hypothetical protein